MVWDDIFNEEIKKPYFTELRKLIEEERKTKTIFPPATQTLNAFNLTPLREIKAVIVGQDPYHGPNQAMGLSFSVNKGVTIPPSLRNIYKELVDDVGITLPTHGDLTEWAKQGVLLLNATLTVRQSEPNSHSEIGWREFTKQAVKAASKYNSRVVFILWGAFAQQYERYIDDRHLILKCAHPSPFSAARGFFGCKHFSKTNEYLVANNLKPINWQIT